MSFKFAGNWIRVIISQYEYVRTFKLKCYSLLKFIDKFLIVIDSCSFLFPQYCRTWIIIIVAVGNFRNTRCGDTVVWNRYISDTVRILASILTYCWRNTVLSGCFLFQNMCLKTHKNLIQLRKPPQIYPRLTFLLFRLVYQFISGWILTVILFKFSFQFAFISFHENDMVVSCAGNV